MTNIVEAKSVMEDTKFKPDYKARKRGEPTMNLRQRLYSHAKKNDETGCWEWAGSKRGCYGRIIVGSRVDGTRRSDTAHRVSYIINFGEIPDGLYVCHKCDNPACINPNHLFLGTAKENMEDCSKKGRIVAKAGENQGRSKLTEESVRDARRKFFVERVSSWRMADIYCVSRRTMWNALTGKTWKCVDYWPEPAED